MSLHIHLEVLDLASIPGQRSSQTRRDRLDVWRRTKVSGDFLFPRNIVVQLERLGGEMEMVRGPSALAD